MFLPQSRPRLFVIGIDKGLVIPPAVRMLGPQVPWHTAAIQTAYDRLPPDVRESWAWWGLPHPMVRRPTLDSIIEENPTGVAWHSPAETKKLIGDMSPANLAKLAQAKAVGRRIVGTAYKRTRPVGKPKMVGGKKVQKRKVFTEIRFDGIAGCLRTPSGGSSRQTVIVVEGDRVRTRLLSTRECARLMGLPDSYRMPENYNDGYHLAGDGVAVPVVRFLAQHLLEPLAAATRRKSRARKAA
jgi:DNA (cytosine-5)-methyltransferase 1